MTWTKMPSLLAWPLVTGLLMVLSGCGGTLAIEVNESSGSSSGNISSSTSSGYSSSGSSYSSSSSSSSSTGGFGSYEDTTLTELQQQLIAQYRTLRDLPLQVGPATRASSSQFNALAQNHLRRSSWA